MEITLVKQKHKKGCGIACLAMVTGKPYDEIAKDFLNDFDEEGTTSALVMEYLSDLGYSIIQKTMQYYDNVHRLKGEFLKPFAESHILTVKYKVDSSWHFIVMDKDGKLFCPDLDNSDSSTWYYIGESIGIYSK